jgi:hypothetical protein
MNKSVIRRILLGIVLSSASLTLIACTPGVQGKYADQLGTMTLELKSGGEARVTMMGQSTPCTYEVKDKKVYVTCHGDTTYFTMRDEDTLSPPPGSLSFNLKKVK